MTGDREVPLATFFRFPWIFIRLVKRIRIVYIFYSRRFYVFNNNRRNR